MSVFDLLLLAIALVFGLYWYLTRHHDYWKTVGVPTVPGVLPGVGNMWDAFVCKTNSTWLFYDFYKLINDMPAIGVYDFRKPTLILKSPNLIQDVLVKEFSSFHDNVQEVDSTLDIHMSRNPFFRKGESWKSTRQLLNPAFSPAKIKAMFPLIERVCQDFNSYIEKHLNEDININNVSGLFSSDVVAKCAFGLDGNAFTDNDSGEFYKQGHRMWKNSFYSPVFMLGRQYFPIINKIFGWSYVSDEATRFFVSLVTQAEKYRTENPDKAPEDYLQYLLNLKKKYPEFTTDDVVGHSLTFYTDGFETSLIVASFVIHELTMNPDIQEALRKEVMSMEAFSFENIGALDLLDRVFKETLRKYGTFAPMKVCTKDHILQDDGHVYPVHKGQQVIVPVYSVHNDPDIYPDPDKFNPDRFLPDAVKSRHPMTFLGFGGGPRMCIGNRFGTTQVKVLIANILKNFRLIKCTKTVEKVKLSRVQILPVAEGGLWCQFQKL